MRKLFLVLLATFFWSSAALAQTAPQIDSVPQIDADRPGTGSDAEVVPLYTLNVEMGTDGREIRLGVLPHLEVDRDETNWGLKYGYIDNDHFKGSVKVTLDSHQQWSLELPMQKSVNKWFYLGTDVIITKDSRTYVGEFNFTPTSRLTISHDIYYDNKLHYGIYAAWIPPRHNNVQFDVGYADHKVTVGIAVAVAFRKPR